MAKVSPTPLTLQQMKTFATNGPELRLKASAFLHNELQIRFARAVVELSELPLGLNETPPVKMAIANYTTFLHDVAAMKAPSTPEEDAIFTSRITQMKKQGSNLVPMICGGLHTIKTTPRGIDALRLQDVQDDLNTRLDTFFLSRIGIRMLIGQHSKDGGRVKLTDVQDIVHEAVARASALCAAFCGPPPPVIVRVVENGNVPFMYTLHRVTTLTKRVLDLTIKISDEGGGVPRSEWRKLWQYTYSTADDDMDPSVYQGQVNFRDHFCGGGYGLPISRLFARYFGGEVTFVSSEGFGSSVFIQAHRLGKQAELVPGHTNFTLQPLTF
ncbi:hypothetical protein DYB34_004246 [Aphanomyces astaci]|uniref:Protein-serine/threonine kinase n=1 Tax=Aphanomyces astaci TaxID=112090 RepID=A0A3R6XCC7_APHAT|nr:hypothetical protein DYB34_004246 [Aphanomyces astaci]